MSSYLVLVYFAEKRKIKKELRWEVKLLERVASEVFQSSKGWRLGILRITGGCGKKETKWKTKRKSVEVGCLLEKMVSLQSLVSLVLCSDSFLGLH